jgi:hypothetical protein
MNNENFENTSLQWEFEAHFELSCRGRRTHRGNPFYKSRGKLNVQLLRTRIFLLARKATLFYQYCLRLKSGIFTFVMFYKKNATNSLIEHEEAL